MSWFGIASVARYELKMQLRRKYVWLLMVLFLLVMFFLVSPFNQPGLVFSSEKLAAHSLFLSLLFSSLLFAFLVSDRISREDALLVRELISSKPIEPFQYVMGKSVGNAFYFLLLFILPVFILMQIMQFLFSGFEGYSLIPFLKIYSFFPFVSAFFIAGTAFYLSRIFGDNLKFFIFFSIFWAVMFFAALSGSGGLLSLVDFTGKFAGQVLFADRFHVPGTREWLLLALNISFLLGMGAIFSLLAGKQLQCEKIVPLKTKSGVIRYFNQLFPAMGYDRNILQWKNFKTVLAFVVITSIILLQSFKGNERLFVYYYEIFLPLLLAFTTTHIFKADQDNRMMELLLSKPISRFKLLSQRYLLLLTPNILIVMMLAFFFHIIHRTIDVGLLISVSLPEIIFLCTVSVMIAITTRSTGMAAAGVGLWILLWINGDIQKSIGPGSLLFFINPFVETFHPGSEYFLLNKFTQLAMAGLAFTLSLLVLRKPERFLR